MSFFEESRDVFPPPPSRTFPSPILYPETCPGRKTGKGKPGKERLEKAEDKVKDEKEGRRARDKARRTGGGKGAYTVTNHGAPIGAPS